MRRETESNVLFKGPGTLTATGNSLNELLFEELENDMMRESSCTGNLSHFLRLLLVVSIRAMAYAGHSTEHAPATSEEFPSGKISASDVQQRQALLQSFQLAAFQQFHHGKTAVLYNVTGFPGTQVRVMRLRLGRFREDGVNISEFQVPRGCVVEPAPRRIALVYARFPSSSSFLFGGLPGQMNVTLPVLSLFAYDASNLSSTQPLPPLSVSTTFEAILVQFQPHVVSASCVYFSENSTAVIYSDLVQGGCAAQQLGVLSRANAASNSSVSSASPSPSSRKQNWKIATGVTIAGVALLALLSLCILGIVKYRKDAKFGKMEYHADQGETLESTLVQNSRVPAAGGTRTRPGLEEDYAYSI